MIGLDRKRVIDLIILILAILGIGISVELTQIHVLTHTDPEFHSVCALSEGVNCETVALSPYSVFAGLPVSVWGIIGYLLLAGLVISGITKRRIHATWPYGGLLVLSTVYAATSAVLAYISFTRIDSLCLFCMATYIINIGLLMLTISATFRLRLNPIKSFTADVAAMVRRPLISAMPTAGRPTSRRHRDHAAVTPKAAGLPTSFLMSRRARCSTARAASRKAAR